MRLPAAATGLLLSLVLLAPTAVPVAAWKDRTIRVFNKCPYPIWVAAVATPQPALQNNSHELLANSKEPLIFTTTYNAYSGRLWARTGCVKTQQPPVLPPIIYHPQPTSPPPSPPPPLPKPTQPVQPIDQQPPPIYQPGPFVKPEPINTPWPPIYAEPIDKPEPGKQPGLSLPLGLQPYPVCAGADLAKCNMRAGYYQCLSGRAAESSAVVAVGVRRQGLAPLPFLGIECDSQCYCQENATDEAGGAGLGWLNPGGPIKWNTGLPDAGTGRRSLVWDTENTTVTCQTGDCSGKAECTMDNAGTPPYNTFNFDFTVTGAGNQDFYDISNVNGFNVPISVVPRYQASNTTACQPVKCSLDTNKCPPELQTPAGTGNNACYSACDACAYPQQRSKFDLLQQFYTGKYANGKSVLDQLCCSCGSSPPPPPPPPPSIAANASDRNFVGPPSYPDQTDSAMQLISDGKTVTVVPVDGNNIPITTEKPIYITSEKPGEGASPGQPVVPTVIDKPGEGVSPAKPITPVVIDKPGEGGDKPLPPSPSPPSPLPPSPPPPVMNEKPPHVKPSPSPSPSPPPPVEPEKPPHVKPSPSPSPSPPPSGQPEKPPHAKPSPSPSPSPPPSGQPEKPPHAKPSPSPSPSPPPSGQPEKPPHAKPSPSPSPSPPPSGQPEKPPHAQPSPPPSPSPPVPVQPEKPPHAKPSPSPSPSPPPPVPIEKPPPGGANCLSETNAEGCQSGCSPYASYPAAQWPSGPPTDKFCIVADWPLASTGEAYPTFFKNACPDAYSYAFDDSSSVNVCIEADFDVTFCPSS